MNISARYKSGARPLNDLYTIIVLAILRCDARFFQPSYYFRSSLYVPYICIRVLCALISFEIDFFMVCEYLNTCSLPTSVSIFSVQNHFIVFIFSLFSIM